MTQAANQKSGSWWMDYFKEVKQSVGRDISDAEARKVMECYLSRKSVEIAVNQLENK